MSKIDVGVFMNTQIAEILEGSIDPWGERDANDIAEEILDLINLEKAKENCYQEEKMRAKGWFHKDDPVKGLKVERGWSNIVSDDIGLKQKRPLTVGEALDMLKGIFDAIEEIKFCFINETNSYFDQIFKHEINLIDKILSTKDGGRIVREG